MSYYFSTKLNDTFEDAVDKTTATLKEAGFGVISEIDINEKLKEKIGVDFRRYKILGACNPPNAYKALQAEDKIGTMLPCNVIVQELGEKDIEVAAINPVASMQAVDNPEVGKIAAEIGDQLQKAIIALR